MCVYACKNNQGMSLVDFGIRCFSFLLFHNTAVWIQQYGSCVLSRGRLILLWLIKARHHYWFIKGKKKNKNAQCIQTNWWCPFECQPGLPHNRINAWIWSERTNTRWTLIKNPSGKDFNEILHKVNKWRCQAKHKNGLYSLFSVVINKITFYHKTHLSTRWVLWEIKSLVVISVIWTTFQIYTVVIILLYVIIWALIMYRQFQAVFKIKYVVMRAVKRDFLALYGTTAATPLPQFENINTVWVPANTKCGKGWK